MNQETREQRILAAACDQFSQAGYYGARMDTIASTAKINKRIVYEFCHTKEELYMMVLSDVSRNISEELNQWINTLDANCTPQRIYSELLDILIMREAFVRLWAWERMATTIHGPRILEASSNIFNRIREKLQAQHISDETFEAIEALCHGYMLTSAMYLRCDPEIDGVEDTESPENGPARRRLDSTIRCQAIILDGIQKLLANP